MLGVALVLIALSSAAYAGPIEHTFTAHVGDETVDGTFHVRGNGELVIDSLTIPSPFGRGELDLGGLKGSEHRKAWPKDRDLFPLVAYWEPTLEVEEGQSTGRLTVSFEWIVFPEYAHLFGGCPMNTPVRFCSLDDFIHGHDENIQASFFAFAVTDVSPVGSVPEPLLAVYFAFIFSFIFFSASCSKYLTVRRSMFGVR